MNLYENKGNIHMFTLRAGKWFKTNKIKLFIPSSLTKIKISNMLI